MKFYLLNIYQYVSESSGKTNSTDTTTQAEWSFYYYAVRMSTSYISRTASVGWGTSELCQVILKMIIKQFSGQIAFYKCIQKNQSGFACSDQMEEIAILAVYFVTTKWFFCR